MQVVEEELDALPASQAAAEERRQSAKARSSERVGSRARAQARQRIWKRSERVTLQPSRRRIRYWEALRGRWRRSER